MIIPLEWHEKVGKLQEGDGRRGGGDGGQKCNGWGGKEKVKLKVVAEKEEEEEEKEG